MAERFGTCDLCLCDRYVVDYADPDNGDVALCNECAAAMSVEGPAVSRGGIHSDRAAIGTKGQRP